MSARKEKSSNSAQGDPPKDELAKRLEAVGLSVEYWLPKLHKQLGITSTQALKHLQYEDYQKLECDVQHRGEKKALQKLLQIPNKGEMKPLQEEWLEMPKRQEQAKSALKELNEMQEKGRSHHEEAVRKKEEELRQAMDIAPEYWSLAEKPLIEVVQNMQKQLDLLQELILQSENLPDEEVLRWASGGLALQGIYKTKQLADMVGKREQLINIPGGFKLFGPQQGPMIKKKEFSSSEAESTFTRTMATLGFSISVTDKDEFEGAEASSDYSQFEHSRKTHHSHSEHTYICTTQYSYIPLASCDLPKDQLRLSNAALQELKEMEQLLSHTPEPDQLRMLKSRGGHFFQRFGSHVNQGPLHFGGIFWWKASSEGFRAEQLDEMKNQTSAALSSYVGDSYSGFGCTGAAGATVGNSGSQASFQGRDRKQSQTEIHLFVTKTGGPPGVASPAAWKSGLLASNKTWAVIDRGSQLIPVWDIILANHRQDFKDVFEMRSSLIHAYQALTNRGVSAEEKKKRLAFLEDHMGNSLSQEIDLVLTKHRQCTDWKALERDLNSLVNGNSEATNDYQQTEFIKKELENVFQETKGLKSLSPTPKEVQPSDIKTDEFLNSGFLRLIKQFKLENYYPKKMRVANFQKIHRSSVYDTYPSKESELPFYFLDKLLMLDYRVRDLICKDGIKTQLDIVNRPNPSDDVNGPSYNVDDIFNNVAEESKECAESNEDQVHPMDLHMAIFHCADDFMRQYISTKLSLCQFALPLLVPDPCTSQIEYLFWSFCQVNKTWQSHEEFQNTNGTGKCKDELIYQADIPVVSFIRLGASSFSKSQFLNTLLSKQKHNIFFHRHCKSSIKNCLLMEGVVEITWYCPGRDKDGSFDNCIAFTNLHGDAREHEQQVNFLQEIASVTVVLLSDTDRNEKGTKVLQDLLKSPKPLILLFTDKERVPINKPGKLVKIAAKEQNEAKLVDEVTTSIKCAVGASNTSCSLAKCADIARKHGFLVDEDKIECKEGKELAEKVIGFLKQENISDIKDKLLPLQGELWQKWCKKDKECTHLQDTENLSIEQHLSQIKSEKHAIRQDQLQRAFPLNQLMQSVLSALKSPSCETKTYFLQWLKIFIPDVSSDHLQKLHQRYHNLWSKKQKGENNNVEEQLKELSHEISASTFGLEHLLREVGQIYEALDALPKQEKCFLELPEIAADLMVKGYPIELMDGDTSYVPLKWVRAIFDKLIEKLGDKKVFVLSVLGIQSTGKSTLLNAMFGLQFRVSAGRCTRGAFMQLVKVDDGLREELDFDFLVVIDTEGLRATKLENRSILSHDNQLATFVIGLGNTTLINIYGENPSEMHDTLQIAVQAFLRMKQVKLSPSCLFVHQNVGDITAKEKNMEGRRCLQEQLDEMAVTAGQQESYDVTCFNDVIQFDVNTHIHYFTHLWEGDPPMAPPNPGYSQNVQKLKREILVAAKEISNNSFLKLSELKTRTQDLWEALLNENFVFSFKNTLEIVVYNRLENNYNTWTWELRRFMLDLQNKLNVQIQNGRISKIDRLHLENRVQEKYAAIEKELERYFSEDKDSNILIQWENKIKTRINLFRQEQIKKICQKSEELINLKNRQSTFEQKKLAYKDELLSKSKELARHYGDMELGESELREIFMQMWTTWVDDVSSSIPHVEEPNINADMQLFLLNHFTSEPNIRNRIRTSSEWTVFPLNLSEHISMKREWYLVMKKAVKECDTENLKAITARLERHISDFIESKERGGMYYNSSYFHEIVELIRKQLESGSRDANFTLTQAYKVDVALYLCQIARRKFRETFKAFQKSNDPVLYLESKKEEFFSCFKIACQGATSITIFADILCNNLKSAILHAVYDKTAIDIANEMRSDYPAFNGNRIKLELFMLLYLLEKEDFETYQQYIYYPEYYMQDFIRRSVDRYCLDKKNPKLKKILNLHLGSFRTLVLSALCEATKIVKDKHGNVALWLDEFCIRLGDDLYLSRSDLRSIEHQEIKDIQFLKEAVVESLDPALEQLKQTFSEINLDPFVSKPHEILFEQLSGCWKKCPFCKAVCMHTIPGHDGNHSTPFHRPQVLNGIQWEGTNHLVIDICSSLVRSDGIIVCNGGKIPWKYYQAIGADCANWDIKQDTFQLIYWKWFVSHFRSDLERTWNGEFKGKGAIPRDWENIDKKTIHSEMKKMLEMCEIGIVEE